MPQHPSAADRLRQALAHLDEVLGERDVALLDDGRLVTVLRDADETPHGGFVGWQD